MEFRTPVEISQFNERLTYNDSLMFLGSCFAENIGNKFMERKFLTDINPFGIIYNPVSLQNCIEILENKKMFNKSDLFEENGIWKSFYHHSRFSHSDIDTTLKNINERISVSSEFIKKHSFLFITIGTAWVFEHKKSGKVVSNCHKCPASNFDHRILSVDETYQSLKTIVEITKKINSSCNLIFTISPVRHLKNGVHGNQLSKSVLIVALWKLQETYPDLHYFPAYEILLDELRDYRFYADDFLHPSAMAVEYIWEKLCSSLMNDDTLRTVKEVENIIKAVQHRPLFPGTKTNQEFLNSLMLKMSELECKHPGLQFLEEKRLLSKIH